MPAYNFQKQFVELIRSGDKHHTVRPRRKRATVPGDKLFLYTGMRTKQCEKIAEVVCTSVVPIAIFPGNGAVVLDGRRLSAFEVVEFSRRDGFTLPGDFFEFFDAHYSFRVLCGELEVIYWR